MTISEVYAALGGNYEDVIGRLRSETLVKKFVLKFPADGNFALLGEAIKDGRTEEAFRAAHTIKGMCQNLSFDRLAASSSEITEALRASDLENAKRILPKVEEDYRLTVEAIKGLDA